MRGNRKGDGKMSPQYYWHFAKAAIANAKRLKRIIKDFEASGTKFLPYHHPAHEIRGFVRDAMEYRARAKRATQLFGKIVA
jgi:hypothetical protein